jgi:hypothetical protein
MTTYIISLHFCNEKCNIFIGRFLNITAYHVARETSIWLHGAVPQKDVTFMLSAFRT